MFWHIQALATIVFVGFLIPVSLNAQIHVVNPKTGDVQVLHAHGLHLIDIKTGEVFVQHGVHIINAKTEEVYAVHNPHITDTESVHTPSAGQLVPDREATQNEIENSARNEIQRSAPTKPKELTGDIADVAQTATHSASSVSPANPIDRQVKSSFLKNLQTAISTFVSALIWWK